jgi:hypothetical protein
VVLVMQVMQWCSGAVVQWCSGAVVQWCWCISAMSEKFFLRD